MITKPTSPITSLVAVCLVGMLGASAICQEKERHVRKPLPSLEEISQLPPDGGEEFNRLIFEKSPYLLQHARNPVDWYAWGEEAFRAAAAQNKPVFLSIGYSTCHWCHVMEHESFEDDEVATLLNEAFICVKLDREERPDLDHIYMTVTQAMNDGNGGWPMTVIMTADKKPFFTGTYFPKRGRYGRWGMVDLIPKISEAWQNQREGIVQQADHVASQLQKMVAGVPGESLDLSTLDRAYAELGGRYDRVRGGFSVSPKFPVPHNMRFLMRYYARTGTASALSMAETTLVEMRKGGVWDHVGLGFHRYSTDREWFLPHFEKMLYDQALLTLAYVEAWQVTGKADYRKTADEILAYVSRELTDPAGGFYSAEDADSEGEEGLFYLWTWSELMEALGEEDGKFAAEIFGAEVNGNYREESSGAATGKNILFLEKSLAIVAKEQGMELAALEQRLESIRQRLFAIREPRIHPFKDDKVLTDWNGLMIAAYAAAGRAFDHKGHIATARRAAPTPCPSGV